jgi:hypothetical protein
VPRELQPADFPLQIKAALIHRARLPSMEEDACADGKTDRGQAFAEWSARIGGGPIDACQSGDAVVVAEATLQLGPGARAEPGPVPEWERLVRHALALSVGFQERLEEARPSLQRALALTEKLGRTEKARVRWAFAQLAARQGRVDEALTWVAAAERLHRSPALEKTRGDALTQVWRWREAASAYAAAARGAPNDLDVLRGLAIAEASAGRPAEALAAAKRALQLSPRDPDCLRVQALALEKLGAAPAVVAEAISTALHWRPSDGSPRARAACSNNVPLCATRRNPFPTYELPGSGVQAGLTR